MGRVISKEVADYEVRSWEPFFQGIIGHNRFNEAYLNWKQPWRHYHDIRHFADLLRKLSDWKDVPGPTEDKNFFRDLLLVALYHDDTYDPTKLQETINSNPADPLDMIGYNEYNSGITAKQKLTEAGIESESIQRIVSAIFDTYRRTCPSDHFSATFWMIDNSILNETDFKVLIDYENRIFKEFQYVPYAMYKSIRAGFLRGEATQRNNQMLNALADYVEQRRPRIGIYPGSFRPMHVGHYDILQKAEAIFDKVILVYGNNPEKEQTQPEVPNSVKDRQVIAWSGLTPMLMQELEKDCDVVLVRGLRNGKDLDYEVNQLRFMEYFMPNIKVCYIQCNKNFEHISSSAIRAIAKFSEDAAKSFICQ